MIPSKIKIVCFAKRWHMGTPGGKGLKHRNDRIFKERIFSENPTAVDLMKIYIYTYW